MTCAFRMPGSRTHISLCLSLVVTTATTTGVKNAIEIWRIDLKKKYIVYSDEPETKAEWLSELEACIAEAQTLQASQGSARHGMACERDSEYGLRLTALVSMCRSRRRYGRRIREHECRVPDGQGRHQERAVTQDGRARDSNRGLQGHCQGRTTVPQGGSRHVHHQAQLLRTCASTCDSARSLSLPSGPTTCSSRSSDLAYFT